ncbi:PREDICTED: S-type anion channel SLAH3-like [Ipomoea nil]|uniref:S-type anion channel SLAH3-like n=1 Tax=Ipomoea nil TaxID=35883 RepID=UPI000900A257|nr:PREDICTED: S-type anion channel SLAH3-like [Ipomoea nil]
MEKHKQIHSESSNSTDEVLPVLIHSTSRNRVDSFDCVKEDDSSTSFNFPNHSSKVTGADRGETPNILNTEKKKKKKNITENLVPSPAVTPESARKSQAENCRFFSVPSPDDSPALSAPVATANPVVSGTPRTLKAKDKRFNTFKTWSGRLERQFTSLSKRRREEIEDWDSQSSPEMEIIAVDRYYDALEGPELDTLRASEESALPKDMKWPFLLRFPISSFGVCLGVSSQAIMWKALATATSTRFLHINLAVNLVLWSISAALVAIVAFIYAMKVVFYFEAVRREYYHPVRVNFFFAPWIALLFLALGVPPSVIESLHKSLWYILMAPIFCLEVKLYGQWMSGGQRRLSKVANPSNHLSVVGNFVGALLGATMGLKEGPIFFFAVGLAHYSVLFVTLYQRLPTNDTLPKELHPVFFLFVAAPSVASLAWAKIHGSFDYVSKIAYFIALFLYVSLAVRINFFRGFKFSLAWWAYTFPMTGAGMATIKYSAVVTNTVSKCVAVVFCGISTLTVTALLVTTIVHAFVLRDLFPNDNAIAISDRGEPQHKRRHRRNGSSALKDTYLRVVDDSADIKDIEAAHSPPTPNPAGTSNLRTEGH